MELEKYKLKGQEQLAVSLYLKSMNKIQAASDAGYGSPSVFNNPKVKAAIAEQLSIRAERLRVGGDWVLMELKRVYDRCMQTEKVIDQYGATGEFKFDAANAIRALNIIGKHVDVRAFEVKDATATINDVLVDRLNAARHRLSLQSDSPKAAVSLSSKEPIKSESEPPVSFLRPDTANS